MNPQSSCTSGQPWLQRCRDLASSSSLNTGGRWGFQFPKQRKELSLSSQEAPTESVSKTLSHTSWNSQSALLRRETWDNTHTQKWVQIEGSKFFWILICSSWSGFIRILHIQNSQRNVRSCFSDIERQFFVYLEEKKWHESYWEWNMENARCSEYLYRVLSYCAKEEPLAWNKSYCFEIWTIGWMERPV